MNLYITPVAKKSQISFLLALDNYLSTRKQNHTSQLLKRLHQFIAKHNPGFKFQVQEASNQIELYAEDALIGYYPNN
ncbi:hypothetical protein [Carboxylicivirga linearis]|uniref:Uncharacterized protein n=1 Tax=Carboxylicivirga linearis TaxID=1628157 RepID=A0ABS5JRG9_9BACT|nr:hypothetical protein [Carboxylicivirga linearis]MBS2097418.1 hypothetical protein [Carboxylicivirga linearis]